MVCSTPAGRVKSSTGLVGGDPCPGTRQAPGKGLWLDEFAHVLGPRNALDKLPTPSEATDGQGAVVEGAPCDRKLDQDGFYGGQ